MPQRFRNLFYRDNDRLHFMARDHSAQKILIPVTHMNEDYRRAGRSGPMYFDHPDVAFAQYPVIVTKESPPWAMAY